MLKSLPCLASLRRRPQLPQRRPLLPSPPRQPLVLLLRPRRRLLRSRVEESRQDTLAPLRLELPKPPLLGVWPLSVLKIAKSSGAAAGLRGPAPRPWDRVHVEEAPGGQIVVDVARLYQGPKGEPSKFNDDGAFLPG